MGLRTDDVRYRLGPRRPCDPPVLAGLLSARVRHLHRDHDAQSATGDEEDPQGPAATGSLPRREVQDPLPAGLPEPTDQVRPRGALTGHARRRSLGPQRSTVAARYPSRRLMTEKRSTVLLEAHQALGAKLIDFGGWEM